MNEPQECKVYLDHLRAEHLRIDRLVRQVREMLVPDDHPASQLTMIQEKLRKLRDELSNHFREEEYGGCMDEAIAFKPSISKEAKLVQAQHPYILEMVDDLLIQVGMPTALDDLTPLRNRVDELGTTLHCHEEAEMRVLEHGFGVSMIDEPLRAD